MKKRLFALLLTLCMVFALGTAVMATNDANTVFAMTDFGLWGDSWPGAFNVGWKYADGFDTDSITGLEAGMKDGDGNLIVKYTAAGDQLTYQRNNGYINAGGLASAPFYKEYNGTAIKEGADLDWTVVFGSAFENWNVETCYVTVTVGAAKYTLTMDSSHDHVYESGACECGAKLEESAPETYTVTVAAATNGTVAVDKQTAVEGEKVTITATPAAGYVVTSYDVKDAQNKTVYTSDNYFTMPASNVTVSVTFTKEQTPPAPTFDVTVVKTENGTVTVDKTKAAGGDTVKVTATPAEGYEIDKITVTDAAGHIYPLTNNAFTMPKSAVRVEVTFKKTVADDDEQVEPPCDGTGDCPCLKFTDLNTASWYHEAVDYVLENGIMEGDGTKEFKPKGTVTRSMMVQVLYKLEGKPEADIDNPYSDVDDDAWYAPAVLWATENGIIKGNGAGEFMPGDPVTREQIATIMYRYAEYKEADVSVTDDLADFPDADEVSSWAEKETKWAVAIGLINGKGVGDEAILAPTDHADRASIAAILMRFSNNAVFG